MIWYGFPASTLGNRPPCGSCGPSLEVDRVACVGIGGLRCVTEYAHLNAASRSAVRGELIMTPVATLSPDHVAHHVTGEPLGTKLKVVLA